MTPDAAGYQTSAFAPENRGGSYDGTCYSVSAYSRTLESKSSEFCVGSGATLQTMRLAPIDARTAQQICTDTVGGRRSPVELEVGYVFSAEEKVLGDTRAAAASQLGLRFDTSSLANRRVTYAALHLEVKRTLLGPARDEDRGVGPEVAEGREVSRSQSCVERVNVGRSKWWERSDSIDSERAPEAVGRVNSAKPVYDVTSIVQKWASGGDNYGFVLTGGEIGNECPFIDDACMTEFAPGSISLEVNYR